MTRSHVLVAMLLLAVLVALARWFPVCVGASCFDRFKAENGQIYIDGEFFVAELSFPTSMDIVGSQTFGFRVALEIAALAYSFRGDYSLVLYRPLMDSTLITTRLTLAGPGQDIYDVDGYCAWDKHIKLYPRGGLF